MFGLTVVIGVMALIAAAVYLGFERLGPMGVGFAALRTVALGALLLLFLNPAKSVREAGGPSVVLLDASRSMNAAGGRWRSALDTARARAGGNGTILRFGSAVVPFDTALPADGLSRLSDALSTARALGGPITVVSDGELSDLSRLWAMESWDAEMVLLQRDTVPNAALLDVHVPRGVQAEDSVIVQVTIGTWGALPRDSGRVEIYEGTRRISTTMVALPSSPGVGRRQVSIPPERLSLGDRVIRVALTVDGDAEPGDDARLRVTTVTDLPAVVVLVDPADYEGRFLFQEMNDIASGSVRGYSRVADDRWVEMGSMRVLADAQVASATQAAALVVHRSTMGVLRRSSTPTWLWPAGRDAEGEFFEGDWYLTGELTPSPLLGGLVGVDWDSLPPLTGLRPLVPGDEEWVGLSARRSRRGPARPVLIGVDSGQGRLLTTAATGMWRWAFRGGAAREAYRTVIAAGLDWLLGANVRASVAALIAQPTTTSGIPASFNWIGDSIPDIVTVVFRTDTSQFERQVRFDGTGIGEVLLPDGVFRWSSADADASGYVVVEPYSDEFHLNPSWDAPSTAGRGFILSERFVRQRWWLFVVAILAFAVEWGWRQRRGLP